MTQGEGKIDLRGEVALALGSVALPGDFPLDSILRLEEVTLGRPTLQRLSQTIVSRHPKHAILAWKELRPDLVLLAIRYGCRTFHLLDETGYALQSNARGSLALAISLAVRRGLHRSRRLRRLVGTLTGRRILPALPDPKTTVGTTHGVFAADLSPSASPASVVAHMIGSLGPGGSERQLFHLATASVRAGNQVTVFTMKPLMGADAHYLEPLRREGILVRALAPFPPWRTPPRARCSDALLEQVSHHVEAGWILSLLEELAQLQPGVLHCWLDACNSNGVLAGLLAGVPHILLGVRSLSPDYYQAPWPEWWRVAYADAATRRGVTLLANSKAGAEAYARWCGTGLDSFRVIPNGLDLANIPPPLGSDEERRAVRHALGFRDDAFLVAGVFRLSSEKRPDLFLEVIARLIQAGVDTQAFHIGDGHLAEHVRERARALGLTEDKLRFLGRRTDPHAWLRAADVLLLTSDIEGCPNVCLEAQALGVPVVSTEAGGVPETVLHETTGLLCRVGDAPALTAALQRLARDSALRERMAAASPPFVAERFGLGNMVAATLASYQASP